MVFYGVREIERAKAIKAIVECGAPNAKFRTIHGYTGNITSVFPTDSEAQHFADVWNLSF